jgi:hypothetical protein
MRRLFRALKITGGLVVALTAVSLLIRCGDDDDDGGGNNGDTRKVLEIHMIENVTPRPLPGGGTQAVAAARQLVPVNGRFYRGTMGSAVLDNPIQFTLSDTSGPAIVGQPVSFWLLEGIGILSALSDTTDAAGLASVSYNFSGAVGHAVLRATADSSDTAIVYIRANTLIPGATGQAQYVLFEDTVGRVIDFNGPAEGDVPDPVQYLQYLEYLATDHIVVLIEDENQNNTSQLSEPVVGVILTTGYTQKTAEGIGLGSTYDQMIAAYGAPDSVGYDGTPPPTSIYFYKSLGMNIYTEPPAATTSLSPLGSGDRSNPASAANTGYRTPILTHRPRLERKD